MMSEYVDLHWLPIELWKKIFRLATAEEYHDIYQTDSEYFPSLDPFRCQSPTTAISLSRVSKQWQALAAEFLFQRVWVRHGARSLLKRLQSEGYGRYVRHLELPSDLVNHDTANPIRLLDFLACCPRIEILVKPFFNLNGIPDHQFWTNLASQPPTGEIAITSLKRLYWKENFGRLARHTPEAIDSVLANIILHSPNLHSCTLFRSEPMLKDIDRSAHRVLFPSLTTLDLVASPTKLSYTCIQRGDAPNLTTLRIHFSESDRHLSDWSVLSMIGSQLRVVEFYLYTFLQHFDANDFFNVCPNLQVLIYPVGNFLPLRGFQHLALEKVILKIELPSHGFSAHEWEGIWRRFWRGLGVDFANLSGPAFPALKQVILHGDWDKIVHDAQFTPMRLLLQARDFSLEYPDGTPVQ